MKTFQDVGTFVEYTAEQRAGSPYINVTFKATDGPLTGKTVTRGNFATSVDKTALSTIKSLTEGETITLTLTAKEGKDGKTYRNLTNVEKGTKVNSKATKNTDYNDRAARGQALNLAMQVAIAEGRAHDDEYILSLIPRMTALGETVQGGSNASDTNKVSGGSKNTASGTGNSQSNTAKRSSSAGTTKSTSSTATGQTSPSSIDIDDIIGAL